jgi:hypothetical protein
MAQARAVFVGQDDTPDIEHDRSKGLRIGL